MRELDVTQKDVSKALGIAQPTVNQKINNIRPMSLEEAEKLCLLLKISSDEFATYFFYQESCIVQNDKKGVIKD